MGVATSDVEEASVVRMLVSSETSSTYLSSKLRTVDKLCTLHVANLSRRSC